MREWGGDVSLHLWWIMHPSVPALPKNSPQPPRERLGNMQGFHVELSLPPLCSVFPVLSLSISYGIQSSQQGEPHLIPNPNSHGIFFPAALWDFQVGNSSSSISVESSRIQANSSCCCNINQDLSSLRTWEEFFQRELPHHPQIPQELRILEAGAGTRIIHGMGRAAGASLPSSIPKQGWIHSLSHCTNPRSPSFGTPW